jgi:hypothetical protein
VILVLTVLSLCLPETSRVLKTKCVHSFSLPHANLRAYSKNEIVIVNCDSKQLGTALVLARICMHETSVMQKSSTQKIKEEDEDGFWVQSLQKIATPPRHDKIRRRFCPFAIYKRLHVERVGHRNRNLSRAILCQRCL